MLGILQPGAGAGPAEDGAAVWLDSEEEVKGQHRNRNWKQAGARGTGHAGTARLPCLQQWERWRLADTALKVSKGLHTQKQAARQSLWWAGKKGPDWLWGRRQKKNLPSAFPKTHPTYS